MKDHILFSMLFNKKIKESTLLTIALAICDIIIIGLIVCSFMYYLYK